MAVRIILERGACLNAASRAVLFVPVRSAVLLGLAAFVSYLALEQILTDTRAWPLATGAKILCLLVGGLVIRHFGPRTSPRTASVILVMSLGVLAYLEWPQPLT